MCFEVSSELAKDDTLSAEELNKFVIPLMILQVMHKYGVLSIMSSEVTLCC